MSPRVLAALLAAAGLSQAALAAPVVSNAWLRAMPGSLPAGGYFTLANPGTRPLALTGVSSPACGMMMLHLSRNTGGMEQMDMVDRIDVAPGGKVQFAPGGYHVMCMAPKGLKAGAGVPVTLQFSDGSTLTVTFAVRNATGR